MRRVVPAVLLTFLALVALASFKSSAPLGTASASAHTPTATAPPATAPPATTPPATAPPGNPEPTTPNTNPTTPTPATTPPATAPPATAAPATKTFDGDPVDNQYGTVQVRITVQGKHVTAVDALQLPSDRQRSAYISEQAGPYLQQEALQAQSAQIDIVSGATYTSQSYAQSLQSALDKAGI